MMEWLVQEWDDLVLIVALLLASAFCSGSETALTAASRSRLRKKAQEGEGRALLVEQLQKRKDRFIGALLLANNAFNITASVLATSVCLRLFGDAGLAIATFIMTMTIFVFAELVPKSWAIHHPLRSAMLVAPLVALLTRLLSPIVHLMTFVVSFVRREHRSDASNSEEEELLGAIELHAQTDQSAQQEKIMLRSILDLDDVDVSDIMVHRQDVFALDQAMPMNDIIDLVSNNAYSRVPLYQDKEENIVKVLHVKALLRAIRREQPLEKALKEPWFIPETTSLLHQLQLFRQRKEHFALVVDEYGDFKGIVTLEDILEEIVGEIDDEFDSTQQTIRVHKDGSVVVRGSMTVRDLNRHCDWSLPDEDAATIGGLLVHEARIFPSKGQVFSFHGYVFEVTRCRPTRVLQLKITPPTQPLHADNREYEQVPPPL